MNSTLADSTRQRIQGIAAWDDCRFIEDILAGIPGGYHAHYLGEYQARLGSHSRREANLFMLGAKDVFKASLLPLSADDADVCELAERIAGDVRSLLGALVDDLTIIGNEGIRQTLEAICESLRVKPPKARTMEGLVYRLTDHRWWRQALRKSHGAAKEAALIRAGHVHRKASPYASREAVTEHRQMVKRNQLFLELMEAFNPETGEVVDLAQIADADR